MDLLYPLLDKGFLNSRLLEKPAECGSESEGLENRIKTLELHADIFLQKPVTSSQIFAAVSRSMNFHAHQRVKIMVVDDDEQVTTLLTTLLKKTHFQVEVINDPTLFWPALSHIQPDLLVLDPAFRRLTLNYEYAFKSCFSEAPTDKAYEHQC